MRLLGGGYNITDTVGAIGGAGRRKRSIDRHALEHSAL